MNFNFKPLATFVVLVAQVSLGSSMAWSSGLVSTEWEGGGGVFSGSIVDAEKIVCSSPTYHVTSRFRGSNKLDMGSIQINDSSGIAHFIVIPSRAEQGISDEETYNNCVRLRDMARTSPCSRFNIGFLNYTNTFNCSSPGLVKQVLTLDTASMVCNGTEVIRFTPPKEVQHRCNPATGLMETQAVH